MLITGREFLINTSTVSAGLSFPSFADAMQNYDVAFQYDGWD